MPRAPPPPWARTCLRTAPIAPTGPARRISRAIPIAGERSPKIPPGSRRRRFPFAESGGDVSLAEFSDFFRPQSGLLWKFYERDLSARLERSGDKFVPKAAAVPSAFLPAFLNCINVAQQITDAIFGTLPEAKVPFSINVHSPGSDISQITLRIDGVPTVYKNEAEHWQLAQ